MGDLAGHRLAAEVGNALPDTAGVLVFAALDLDGGADVADVPDGEVHLAAARRHRPVDGDALHIGIGQGLVDRKLGLTPPVVAELFRECVDDLHR